MSYEKPSVLLGLWRVLGKLSPKAEADMGEVMTDTPPEQPTIPDVVAEPLNGAETIVEMTSEPLTEPSTPSQPALIPMTEDELREAGNRLAARVQQLGHLKRDHAEQRAEMKSEREEIQREIENLAQTIRSQGR